MPRSSSGLYTLIGRLPVPCEDALAWGKFYENRDARRVAETFVGPMRISTVFLAINHNFGLDKEEEPVLFETMIFGINDDTYQERCTTWDEAEAMHQRAVEVATILFDTAEVTIAAFERLFNEHKASP